MRQLCTFFTLISLLTMLTACGGSADSEAAGGFIDTQFNAKEWKATLDSIDIHKELEPKALKSLRRFIIQHRKHIPESFTYRDIISKSEAITKMEEEGLKMAVTKFWVRTDGKLKEFRLELSATNALDIGVRRFRCDMQIVDAKGEVLYDTPRFGIGDALAPGKSVEPLRLEFAYDRPTGNELNDPRRAKFRKKLDAMEAISKDYTPENFRFTITDIVLENGLSPDKFQLQEAAEMEASKTASAEKQKVLGLLKWVGKNEKLIQKARKAFSPFYIEVTPILTDKGEATHGRELLKDRIGKVESFFIRQKRVPSGAIASRTHPRAEVLIDEIIDFWGWPMAIRIWKGPERPS